MKPQRPRIRRTHAHLARLGRHGRPREPPRASRRAVGCVRDVARSPRGGAWTRARRRPRASAKGSLSARLLAVRASDPAPSPPRRTSRTRAWPRPTAWSRSSRSRSSRASTRAFPSTGASPPRLKCNSNPPSDRHRCVPTVFSTAHSERSAARLVVSRIHVYYPPT